ncbi:MAG: hypothetical protein HY962_00780 [Ignavibacteriae bacterium]|nr:hypothetical protein [Ignavibacteriota bacterium]
MRTIRDSAARLYRRLAAVSLSRFTIGLAVLALLPRIAAVVAGGNFSNPELYETGIIAQNILHGNGYAMYSGFPLPRNIVSEEETKTGRPAPSAFTLPGYVAVMTVVFAVFGATPSGFIVLYILNILVSVFAVLLAYLLMRALFDDVSARLASLLFAIHPPAIALALTFGGGPWYQAVLLLGITSVVFTVRRGTVAAAVRAGIIGGVWILFRAEATALALMFALWIFRKQGLRLAAVYFACVVIVAAPWPVRNTNAFGSFVPLTTNSWLNIWRGFNPEATGGAFDPSGVSNFFDSRGEIVNEVRALPVTPRRELDVAEIYKRRAVAFITGHPGEAVVLYVKKVLMVFSVDYSDKRTLTPAFLFPHVGLTLCALVCLVFLFRRRADLRPLLAVVGFYWLMLPCFHIETRYLLMLSAVYFVLLGGGLHIVRTRSTQHAKL